MEAEHAYALDSSPLAAASVAGLANPLAGARLTWLFLPSPTRATPCRSHHRYDRGIGRQIVVRRGGRRRRRPRGSRGVGFGFRACCPACPKVRPARPPGAPAWRRPVPSLPPAPFTTLCCPVVAPFPAPFQLSLCRNCFARCSLLQVLESRCAAGPVPGLCALQQRSSVTHGHREGQAAQGWQAAGGALHIVAEIRSGKGVGHL